ncbi:MAG: GDSL-type esterase/lipase family protein, partial [Elusimicrobiota bacterium]|nr:GDSL-type esterase/lipase family protein [Elusimicrobiota bacterium]
MKIICLGDSLTYGYAISRRYIWTSLAAAITGFDIVNQGINGDTTGGMLSRFQRSVLDEKPDAVLVIGGANDIFASSSLDNVKANIFSMRHLAANANIAFLAGTPLPIDFQTVPQRWASFSDMQKADELCRIYTDWLKSFCAAFGAKLIDLWSLYEKAVKNSAASLYLDGLHPNQEGHQIIA